MFKNQKGFTLLELIVVIAIIAILATVTMWSISSYKAKNDDAVVKAGIKTVINQAEIYNLNNGGSYANMCDPLSDSVVTAALNQIKFSAVDFDPAVNCVDSNQDWVVWAELKGGGGTWCADARNFAGFGAKSTGNYCQ